MKIREDGNLFVGTHEWAWSIRTQGFPIYAILQDGEVVEIGSTQKRAKIYKLPKDTIAILREYVSNSGRRTLFVYTIPDLQEFAVGDSNNWDTSELPSNLQGIIEGLIQKHLADP